MYWIYRQSERDGSCSIHVGLLCLWAMLGAATGSLADIGVGGWQSPAGSNWPLIPTHVTLTPDGRVVTYGSKSDGKQSAYFIYDVWDPADGLSGGHHPLDNQTQTDIFCSAQVVLPQSGNIFLAGGDNWNGTSTDNTGNNNTKLFDYTSNALTRANNLNRPRWYSTTTMLVNGEVYIQGGRAVKICPRFATPTGISAS
jgi:hypothetical protein